MKSWLKPSLNWLFIFIPITVLLDYLQLVSPPILFFAAALSIIPIAKLIVRATENLSTYTGDAVGGLLNATFGNAPELIIMTVALKEGLHEMVLASLIGAILANLLLSLGLAFFIGGLHNHTQEYNPVSSRMYSSMMMVAVISLIVPSSFSRFFGTTEVFHQEMVLNVGLAIVLLVAYVLFLLFSLKTHKETFGSVNQSEEKIENRWSLVRSIITLVGASVLAAWMSEILVGAAEGTGETLGMTTTFIGIVFLAIIGGAAESFSAIAIAKKNKMDLSISIVLGSCIQITLFLAPVLVLLSFFIGPAPLQLAFTKAEIGALFLAVLIGTVIAGDGRSNWYKGVQLITVYLILAMLFFFMPEMQ